jgi:hypothetical protein
MIAQAKDLTVGTVSHGVDGYGTADDKNLTFPPESSATPLPALQIWLINLLYFLKKMQ